MKFLSSMLWMYSEDFSLCQMFCFVLFFTRFVVCFLLLLVGWFVLVVWLVLFCFGWLVCCLVLFWWLGLLLLIYLFYCYEKIGMFCSPEVPTEKQLGNSWWLSLKHKSFWGLKSKVNIYDSCAGEGETSDWSKNV